MAEAPGQTIAHFRLEDRLGSGGFATVYRARDLRLGRPVAVKVLRAQLAADAGFVARFQAEAKAEAVIRHPHIVTLYEAGMTDEGIPYLVMELLEGRTLSLILHQEGPLPPGDLVNLVAQLASALDYLHARRIVHRDIKPANVIVDVDGQSTLMDLGIARSLDAASLTLPGQALGTPIYMSPEQITGRPIGPSADRYALGILCYELLTGKPPFQGTTSEIMRAQVLQPPPPVRSRNPNVPDAVAEVVERMLAKRPDDRYESSAAFASALADAAQGLGERSTIIRPPSRNQSRSSPVPGELRPVRVERPPQPALYPVAVPDSGSSGSRLPYPPPQPAPAPLPPAPNYGMHTGWIAAGLLVAIALLTLLAVVIAIVRSNDAKPSAAAGGAATAVASAPPAPTASPTAAATATAVATATRVPTVAVSAPNPVVPDTSLLTQTFNSAERGYSIQYPTGWTSVPNQRQGDAILDVFRPAGGAPNVSVLETNLAAGATLAQFLASGRSELASSKEFAGVTDAGSVAVGRERGEMVFFQLPASGTGGAQVYYVTGRRGFTFTLGAQAGQREQVLPMFAGMLQTFKVP